jgi:hypothetical protein
MLATNLCIPYASSPFVGKRFLRYLRINTGFRSLGSLGSSPDSPTTACHIVFIIVTMAYGASGVLKSQWCLEESD